MCSLEDPRGTRDTAPNLVQFLSFSCSFRQKSCQIIGFWPKLGSWRRFPTHPPLPTPLPAPPGKSLIRHWCLGWSENKEVSHWSTTSTKGTKPIFISAHSLLCRNSYQDRTCTKMNRTVLLLKIWNRTLSLG